MTSCLNLKIFLSSDVFEWCLYPVMPFTLKCLYLKASFSCEILTLSWDVFTLSFLYPALTLTCFDLVWFRCRTPIFLCVRECLMQHLIRLSRTIFLSLARATASLFSVSLQLQVKFSLPSSLSPFYFVIATIEFLLLARWDFLRIHLVSLPCDVFTELYLYRDVFTSWWLCRVVSLPWCPYLVVRSLPCDVFTWRLCRLVFTVWCLYRDVFTS